MVCCVVLYYVVVYCYVLCGGMLGCVVIWHGVVCVLCCIVVRDGVIWCAVLCFGAWSCLLCCIVTCIVIYQVVLCCVHTQIQHTATRHDIT